MKLISRNFIFFLVIANCLFAVSQIPLFLHIIRNPKDALFPLVHFEFTHDYYTYLAAITQGKAGYFLHFNPYSAEPSTKGIFYVYYIFWGHIARLFSLSSYVTYHISRVISLELFFISLFALIRLIVSKRYVLWASLFSIIITIPPNQFFAKYLGQQMNYSWYPSGILWWLSLDAFDRLNGIPHHIFGQATLLAGIAFLLLFLQKNRMKYAFYSGFILFIGGVVFPAILVVPLAVSALLIVLKVIKKRTRLSQWLVGILGRQGGLKKITRIQWFVGLLFVFVSALSSLSIAFYQEHQGYPWDDWRKRELIQWNILTADFDRTLVFSFAPYIVLGAVSSVMLFLSSPTDEHLVLIVWASLPFMLLPFANSLGIPKIRLIQLAPFVPIGILTSMLFFNHFKRFAYPKSRFVVFIIFVIFSLYVSVSILLNRIEAAKMYVAGHQMHIPKVEVDGFHFIEQNVPKESIILSDERPGNIIPAFAPTISYIGHGAKVKDFYIKLNAARLFFAGKLTDNEALTFIKNNRIAYVWFGPDEKITASTRLNYPFLQILYEKGGIIFYRIRL